MSPYRIIPRTTRLKLPSSHILNQSRLSLRPWPRQLLSRAEFAVQLRRSPFNFNQNQQRYFSTPVSPHEQLSRTTTPINALPLCCPGCGAYSQVLEPNEPGYYGRSGKQMAKQLSSMQQEAADQSEKPGEMDDLRTEGEKAADTIDRLMKEEAESDTPKPRHGALLDNATATASTYLAQSKQPPRVCDRCHDLLHHNKAVPAVAPSIHSIREYLNESPWKDNHIYHVIDAADFPLSLVRNIYQALSAQEQRAKNRRATTDKYRGGRKLPTIHFIITRSDLLAPTKEQVDSKMEYMRMVLREALRLPQDIRLGNVHMISAHRGWWTKEVKEEMRKHGGGVWVVGKSNVGKSSFIEACFPKDSKNAAKVAELVKKRGIELSFLSFSPSETSDPDPDPNSLLPPAPREDLFPVLPVVSSHPGTTVSPIRIPFGRGKGEMIDLPGLDRGELADYVKDEFKRDMFLTSRQKPERLSIRPGQSLLLGSGLVRITPVSADDVVVMAACFLGIKTHLTNTQKAIEMQAQQRAYPGEAIVKDGIGDAISSAGLYDLRHDVTKSHLPTSMAKALEDKGIQPPPLPYKVLSTDILIEGCGWVELTAQIRTKGRDSDDAPTTPAFPQVEVFSPQGRHIGARYPIECYGFTAERQRAQQRKKGARGRQNIGQVKRSRHSSKA